jgi:hypothetical protein
MFKNNSLEYRKQQDQLKKTLCKDNGITLINIPYWWDGTKDQLISTIRQYQPNFLPQYNYINNNIPISNNPPRLDDTGNNI